MVQNKSLEKALDHIAAKRLIAVKEAISSDNIALIERAAKQVVVIGTRTATGSIVFLARHTKDPKVQAALIRQLAAFSPLRQEYKPQLLEIIPDAQQLAQLYATYDHSPFAKPLWHEMADTFNGDTQELERILQM